MRILFVSHYCCVRTVKEGLALLSLGHDVIFVQQMVGNLAFLPILPSLRFYEELEQLGRIIKAAKVDLVHVHNGPDDLVLIAKENTDAPVIYDAHDLVSVFKPENAEAALIEAKAIEVCDGMVVPSRGYLNYVQNHYLFDKPIEVICSWCNEWMLELVKNRPKLSRINGIAFEGGVANFDKNGRIVNEWETFRDYRKIVSDLNDLGIPMHIFTPDPKNAPYYHRAGAEVVSGLLFRDMLWKLTRYDWGFCGTPHPHQQWDWAMPNKFFEYICAGLPVIVMNAAECADFVREMNVGIVVKDAHEIRERYDEHEDLKKNVLELRETLLIENHIGELDKLYKRVLEKATDACYSTDPDGGLRIGLAGRS